MAEQEFWPGDWVQVWARVDIQERTHPEDLRISVDSHNAVPEAIVVVRKDRVLKPERVPDWVERCTHLSATDWENERLHRCAKHEGHSGNHQAKDEDFQWDDKGSVGFIEEKR